MENNIVYRKALVEDALRLSLLYKQVYIHTYAVDGITHEYANHITKRFSVEAITAMIQSSPDSIIVALYNDNPVGVAEIHFDKECPIGNFRAPELSKLYILESFTGKGIGKALLQQVEQMVKAKGYPKLWLWVYALNPRAIQFYKLQQYEEIGTAYYQMEVNNYENKVMQKVLA